MAKFIIVLCAIMVATASAGPGLVAPLGGVPVAYAPQLAYSSPLTYSAALAYSSPVAYGLASGGSSRIDIQNNYNVPFLANPFAYSSVAPFTARLSAPYTIPAPVSYSIAPIATPQFAKIAAAPIAVGASAPLAKIAAPVPAPFGVPQLVPSPLRYSAPLLNNFNAQTAAFYGSPLAYALPGQINALPLAAAPLTAASVTSIAEPVAVSEPLSVATTRMTAVSADNAPEADSESVPAKLVSESPVASSDDAKFATPAPVDGPQVARDASSASQSPVVPVRQN